MDTQTIPIVNDESERKESIVENTPAIFEIRDNPDYESIGCENCKHI